MEDKEAASETEVLPVRVIARARPLLESELLQSSRSCVSFPVGGQTLVLGKDRVFTFDAVYVPSAPQATIYSEWVSPLVDGCFNGYNATVLAYGQTGAGKTYTMGSGNNAGKSDDELGIIPRVMQDIYRKLEGPWKSERQISIRVSYIEIYNDEIKDLLHPGSQSKAIAIRERADGTIVLAGVKEVEVNSLKHMQQLLEDGSLCRTVAGTLMNTNSSRSHSIFTVTVDQRMRSEAISAKFHLVDLAGSERAKRTGNVGLRLKESVNINAGLLALGNVISALGDDRKKLSHVPYRESKLTRMLQDSLGGNSRTLMIACISPADPSFEETLNTLKYAYRARNIKNKPIVNRAQDEVADEAHVLELARLRLELEEDTQARLRNDELQAQVETLTLKLAKAEATVRRLGEANFQLTADKEQALMQVDDARGQLAALAEHVRRLNETRAMRHSLRASLETVEHQLLAYGAAHPVNAHAAAAAGPRAVSAGSDNPRAAPDAHDRPATAPSGVARLGAGGAEDERVRALREQAERAHEELAAKTRELEALEAALSDPNTRVAKSVSDLFGRDAPSAAAAAGSAAAKQDPEARGVIERNLRKIRRLEEELQESERARESLAAQVSELREDLARDEEIFAQKQEEIKSLSDQLGTLSNELEAAQAQIRELVIARESNAATNAPAPTRPATAPAAPDAREDTSSAHASNGGSGASGAASVGRPVDLMSSLSEGLLSEEGLTVTMQQQANRRLASYVDDDDLVQVGDDLEDSIRPAAIAGTTGTHREALERGFAALEREKERLTEEKRALEEHTHALSRRFHVDQHHAERRLKALEFNMQLKQELIRTLVKTEQDLQAVNDGQQQRIRDMEREIEGLRLERDRTSSAGSGSSRSRPDDMTPEHRRIRDQFTAKLRAREQELESLKKQQEESARVMRQQEQKEKHIRALEAEVLKMAQQSEQVKARAREEAERYERLRADQSAKLREVKAKMDARVRELEAENERQREALQRKTDELDGARSALRARGGGGGRPGSSPAARRPGGGDEGAQGLDGKQRWLDTEIEEFLRKKQAVEQLEKELRKREDIIAAKEDAARRRAGLQLKRGRKEEEVRQSMRGLEERISQISAQISTHGGGSSGNSGVEDLQQLRGETALLQRKREEAVRARAELEQTLRARSYLDEDDEALLQELEDRLDGLDMEIEYKGQAIAELQAQVASAGGATRNLDAIIAGGAAAVEGIGADESGALLRECVQRVLVLREVERRQAAELQELRAREEEAAEQVQSLRAAELEADRRITELQREHETRVHYLLDQLKRAGAAPGESGNADAQSPPDGRATVAPHARMPSSGSEKALTGAGAERARDEAVAAATAAAAEAEARVRRLEEQVSMLDKDNFYYKQSNANLKRRLRELAAAAEQDREALARAAERATALEAQVVNLKGYMRTVGAEPVRLSKQELRPLTPADVDALRASRAHS